MFLRAFISFIDERKTLVMKYLLRILQKSLTYNLKVLLRYL